MKVVKQGSISVYRHPGFMHVDHVHLTLGLGRSDTPAIRGKTDEQVSS